MSHLRNLPTESAKRLEELISVRSHQVVSMSLTKDSAVRITLFAFDEGEGVSEEIYPGDTLYYVIEGKALITKGEAKIDVNAGESVMITAGCCHSLLAKGTLKLLEINTEGSAD